MKKSLLAGCFPFLFSASLHAENVQVIFDDMFVDTINSGFLPVVIIENNDRKDNAVYLSFHSSQQLFIFTVTTKLYQHVAEALSSLPPGIDLTFSCEVSILSWCSDYISFDLHYDLYRSELVIFYVRKKLDKDVIETDPLLIISNNISYSYSQSRIDQSDSSFGFWSSNVDYGVTNSLSLHAGSRYNFSEQSLGIDNVSVVRPFHWGDVSLFFNERSNHLSNFSAGKFIGMNVSNSRPGNREGQDTNNASILITVSADGVLNLHNRFGELKQTSRAVRGLNYVILNRSDFDRGVVSIEIVQNGVVVETIERVLEGQSSRSQFEGLSVGMTQVTDQENRSTERLFAEIDFLFDQVDLSAGSIEDHAYYLDLGYSSPHGFRLNGNVEYQQDSKKAEVETRSSYYGNLYGWRYSPAVMYKFGGETDIASFNLSLLKQMDNYLVNINYNQQKKMGELTGSNDGYERLDANVSSTIYTRFAKISWSAYGTTDLINEHGVGLSLTFSPSVESDYIKPTLNASYSKNRYQVRGVNEMVVNDELTLLPEVTLGQGKIDGYGIGTRINNEHLNSDVGAYRTEQMDALNINLYSNVYVSPHTVMARAEKQDSQLVFMNREYNADNLIEVNIDGVRKSIKNGEAVLSHGALFDGNETRVYSLSEQVNIPDRFHKFVMPKYRAKEILFQAHDDRVLVHGRVIKNGSPVSGASIVNHISKTISDANGYFQLHVSRAEPVISVYHNDSKCHAFSLKNKEKLSSEMFIGRLECAS